MGCLAIALLLAVAWEGCHVGPLKVNVAMQRCPACWKICVWIEAGPSPCRLQTGRGFLDIQPPVDLPFCRQPRAIPAPVDLSALICRQNDACMVLEIM